MTAKTQPGSRALVQRYGTFKFIEHGNETYLELEEFCLFLCGLLVLPTPDESETDGFCSAIKFLVAGTVSFLIAQLFASSYNNIQIILCEYLSIE